MNPLAQTFYVPIAQYPNGMFITSVDLCFRTKSSSNLPVTVQIRPTNNGFPSGSVIMPFSEVSKLPIDISTTESPNFTDNFTRFTFKTPVYLTPGEYALIVFTNDPNYEIYTAVMGQQILGDTRIVSEPPYSGVFFKSSNSSTFSAFQEIDMMFRLNRALFTIYDPKEVEFVNSNVSANTNMDTIYVQAQALSYGLSEITWSQKTTPNSTSMLETNFAPTQVNETRPFSDGSGRRLLVASPSGNNGKYFLKARLQTFDPAISPMIDTERMSINAIENQINNDNANETGTFGGNALTRYISRRVTLADGFDATCLKVYITAYKPLSTDIKVYAKILSRDDPDPFDTKNWTLLSQVSSASLYSKNEDDPREFEYAPSSDSDIISYVSNGTTFSTFATFAIKIVCLTSDTTVHPVLYDMRAIALPK